ncbi:response regulator [Aquincola tertiaricarbonis]|uniref:Response regulator n=1 Tax=Aquincola tertiaricarbonis TaxID=391953 RepID=A0ABY4S2A5_AQUTE|nr:response regulator [Aquincola tertiaricarbonis]URI06092.1 response regulator [Aquincola tertiaricarbonis]
MARILVIEDNQHNLQLARVVLEHAAHQVSTAMDALQGLAIARSELPDLVLMDIQMPGMDGLDATRALRRDPQTASLRVLALTGLAMSGDEQRILAAGCDGYITKPYDYRALLDKVAALLAQPPRSPA